MSAPLTRRRALLASCLAAAGDRPTMGAISSKGRSNMSWRTKARRSPGPGNRGRPGEPGRPNRPGATRLPVRRSPAGLMTGSGRCTSRDSSRRTLRERSMLRQHAGDDRGQPSAKVLDVGVSARLTRTQGPGPRRRPRRGSPTSGRRRPAGGSVLLEPRASQSFSPIGHILAERGSPQ